MPDRDDSYALPAMYYGDPSDAVDTIRAQRKIAEKKAERERRRKSARIKAKVREAMNNGGSHGR